MPVKVDFLEKSNVCERKIITFLKNPLERTNKKILMFMMFLMFLIFFALFKKDIINVHSLKFNILINNLQF